jgi:hypothetical protein
MKEYRSASQILFGVLPNQTVDLRGGVWKVREWAEPIPRSVDQSSLRRELIRMATPWEISKQDGGFVDDLRRGIEVGVSTLNLQTGVKVQPFPEVWMCKACNRISDSALKICRCGRRQWGQLPFVGYHDQCGAIRAPYIKKCPAHNDVKVILPGTSSAGEIRFICPECNRLIRKGFGFPACNCGNGRFVFNVHRAASVYTPRTVVVVNSPSREIVKRLNEAGGPSRALNWVLSGLQTKTFEQLGITKESLRSQLISTGISPEVVELMVDQAAAKGQLTEEKNSAQLPTEVREEAEAQAANLAMALTQSRIRLSDLAAAVETSSRLRNLYEKQYPETFRIAGIETIELTDKFPVLTGSFGYTRGPSEPGISRLVPFRDQRGNYVVYADIAETEALLIRLDPVSLAKWLSNNGFRIKPWTDPLSARVSLLEAAVIPRPGELPQQTAGSALLRLVHSYAHLLIKKIAVYSGIERNALSELLLPQHGCFFVYAAARGDFVLGGLQAVFETELNRLLKELVASDSRCPLDPGCARAGSACMACLHLGEPSCRYYNQYLNRAILLGPSGYFQLCQDTSRSND